MIFFDLRQRPSRWLSLLIVMLTIGILAGCGGGGGGGGSSAPTPVTINGLLTDTKTGIKLGGYIVTVKGTSPVLQATTGAINTATTGQFTITGVTPGSITLLVTDNCGNSLGTIPVTVGTGSNNLVNIGTVSFDLSDNLPPPCFP